ncbi:MAG: LamB/YcsF family protein [Proteobacteria bacterium]|nr:MAG: LamB/YcsF family protein [Pseudomonadota bacterium]
MRAFADLNCDMGESFGPWTMGADLAVLEHVSSANIACGFHAGDPSVIHRTVAAALERDVAVGAHPSFPDLQGFGRRPMSIPAQEAYDIVVYQVSAVAGFCRALGGRLAHVKAHGALYNMAAKDKELATAIATAVRDVDPQLVLFGLAGSELIRAGRAAGLAVASEVFADRTYQPDGSLTPRTNARALIHDVEAALAQVESMLTTDRVRAIDGTEVPIVPDTICVHGDQPGAAEFARALRGLLAGLNVAVRSPRWR